MRNKSKQNKQTSLVSRFAMPCVGSTIDSTGNRAFTSLSIHIGRPNAEKVAVDIMSLIAP